MKKVLFTLFLALLILPKPALGAVFQSGEELNIQEAVSDDLYASGGVLNLSEEVNGDLVAGGGKIRVEGKVSQDIMAGAGDLNILGEVGDDVRVAGGNIQIDTTVKGDLLAGGGDITLTDKSYVGGDVFLGGGNLRLGGIINGDVKLVGGSIYLNADFSGNLTLLNFDKITFGPQAKVRGTFEYRAAEQISIPANVVLGGVIYNEVPKNQVKENLPAILAGFSLFSFLSTLLFGLILLWIFRYTLLHTADEVYETALHSLGVGFLVLVLTPIAAVILLFTTIGFPLFLVLMSLWLIFLYVGKIMAAALIGFKIVRVSEKSSFVRIFGSFALGALIYTMIGMIPFFGWVINLMLILTALGGFVFYGYEVIEQLRKKKLA